ncbi:hypothetical protein ACFL1I_05260 [Candidatus Omnitrophota bacterium]
MKWLIIVLLGVVVSGLLAGEVQAAEVILKTLVVNPSRFKAQVATLKTYLPKEVTPDDIIDLADLKIDYDVTKGLYFVHKDIKLAPSETATRAIKIEDVWLVSMPELETINRRARELTKGLKESANFNQALKLQKEIEAQNNQILSKQARAKDALPQTHIAVYRENVKTLEAVRSLLDQLEKMAFAAKTVSGPSTRRISVRSSWWVILGVIIALGLVSLVFFVTWQRQAHLAEIKEREKKKDQDEELPQILKEDDQQQA